MDPDRLWPGASHLYYRRPYLRCRHYSRHIASMIAQDTYPLWPYSLQLSNRLKMVGMVGTCCAASVVLYAFSPTGSGFYPPCPFYFLTGLYCPGCGTARALHQLLHGNVIGAVDFNPLMMLFLPFLVYGLVSYILVGLGGRALPRLFASAFWAYAIYGIMFSYWILRNIPAYPFTLLAP